MRATIWTWAALILLVLLAGCSSSGGVREAERNAALPPPDTSTLYGLHAGATEYRIGAQDLLQISVLGVPELSRDVRVNANGQISLPLIGGVQAGGRTIPELEQVVADQLMESYLQNPQVSVFVKEYTSQRVTLEGALNKPGIYPLTGTTSLLQAVAMAGGLDPLAQRDGVVIFRQIEGKKMAAVFDLSKITAGTVEDPQVYGDDIIVVARSGGRSSLQELIKAAPLLTVFYLVL